MNDTTTWIGTGWKMNKTLADAHHYVDALLAAPVHKNIQRFVVPPFTCIRDVKKALQSSDVLVGAQNMHWEDSGAWTGEISAAMLTECSVDIVELGHSERRQHFAETDDQVALKVRTALKNQLIPLICVGESLEARESGKASEILDRQVRAALKYATADTAEPQILIAYEPLWAIGENGIPASADYANARQGEIKTLAHRLLGRQIPCLYGGSVSADNCVELIRCEHLDGLFIGRAAWEVSGYLQILQTCGQALNG